MNWLIYRRKNQREGNSNIYRGNWFKKYKEQQTQEIITPFLLPLIPLVSCFELSPDETLKTSAVFALLRTKTRQ